MTVHGITTTKADLWIHFHPLEATNGKLSPSIYLYNVEHCRDFIARHKLAVIFGHSKDAVRSASGAGYLVPKNSPFVTRQTTPIRYATDFPWHSATDREAGSFGERCVKWMIFKDEIWLPSRQLRTLKERVDQLSACDFEVVINCAWRLEIKTERVRSENLFVQSHEQGHQPNFAPDGTERVTKLDGFAEDNR